MFKFIIVFLFIPAIIFCQSLGMAPGEITYNNLSIGEKYDSGKISNIQFEVVNKGDGPVTLRIICFAPSPGSGKRGYEPVPDRNWISIKPNTLDLKPKTKEKIYITISIPNDKKYLGKSYEVYIQAATTGGSAMGIAINNRILFNISKEVPDKSVEAPDKPPKWSVSPIELKINKIQYGKDGIYPSVEIKNASSKTVAFEMKLLNMKEADRKLTLGYTEFPDIKSSRPNTNTFELKKGVLYKSSLLLHVKNKKDYKQKKYQFFIGINTVNENVTEGFFVPVYINMEK